MNCKIFRCSALSTIRLSEQSNFVDVQFLVRNALKLYNNKIVGERVISYSLRGK